jgi:murein DD-endopeptidase MepM/ murein hydrolase activator NlpD
MSQKTRPPTDNAPHKRWSWLGRKCGCASLVSRRLRTALGLVAGSALLAILASITWFLLFTGPRDLWRYPPAVDSPYRLPWPAGVVHLCVQGNRAVVSHRSDGEFAYDFAMPVGSDVCAARAGVMIEVEVGHDGQGFDAPSNYILVKHEDGTVAWYVHLKHGGSYVKPGDTVERGQRLGASGNVGASLLPHLHFEVTDAQGRRLPVTFADVAGDLGIPRMFKSYASGNDVP